MNAAALPHAIPPRLRPLAALALGALGLALCLGIGSRLDRTPPAPRTEESRAGSVAGTASSTPPVMTRRDLRDAAVPAADATAASPADDTPIERRIITTGQMTLDVNDVPAAARRLEFLVTGAGGWIAQRESNADDDGHRTATFVVRVPAAQFDTLCSRLAGLGDVTRDAKQTQDVGRTFVDLDARRRNLVREEHVIAGLFARNGRIGDVLEVERELARVRGQIEQVEGELRYLGNQERFSTLTIALTPRRPANLERRPEAWSLGYHATRATRALLGAVRTTTTALLYVAIVIGPFALLIAGAMWLARRARPRLAPPAGIGT